MRTMNIGIGLAAIIFLADPALGDYDREKQEAADRNAPVVIVEDGVVIMPTGQVLKRDPRPEDEADHRGETDEQ